MLRTPESSLQTQLAFIDQNHRGHAGDRLGHGIDTEKAVRRHRIKIDKAFRPAHLELRGLTLHSQRGDHSGQLAGADPAFDHRPHIGHEINGGRACLKRLGKGKARRQSCAKSGKNTRPQQLAA